MSAIRRSSMRVRKFVTVALYFLIGSTVPAITGFVEVGAQESKKGQTPWVENSNVAEHIKRIPEWLAGYETPYAEAGKPSLFPNSKPVPAAYIELLRGRITNARLEKDAHVEPEHIGHLTWEMSDVSYLAVDGTAFLAATWRTKEELNLNAPGYDPGSYIASQYLTVRDGKVIYASISGNFYVNVQSKLFESLVRKQRPKMARETYETPWYPMPSWVVVKSAGERSILITGDEYRRYGSPELRVFNLQGQLTGHVLGARKTAISFAYIPAAGQIGIVAQDEHELLTPREKTEFEIPDAKVEDIRRYQQGRSVLAAMRCEPQVSSGFWRCADPIGFKSLILRCYVINKASALEPMRGSRFSSVLGDLFVREFSESGSALKFIQGQPMEKQSPPHVYELLRVFSALEAIEDPGVIQTTYRKLPSDIRAALEPRPFALLLAALGRPALLAVFDKP